MNTAPAYRRLPGRTFGVFQTHALWRGDDHLLMVQTMPGGESYRRFYYRDIQAIVLRPTRARMWINVALLVLGGVGLYPLLYLYSFNPVERVFAWQAAGVLVLGVLAIINTARGPTCEVRIQTAVQFERVMSLSRLANAQRVLALVRPLILELQPAEATATVSTAADTAASPVASTAPAPVIAVDLPPMPPPPTPPPTP